MVLKTLFALLLNASLLAAPLSIGKNERRLFQTAKSAYKRGQYQESLQVLTRAFNLNDPRTPSGALFLAAYSFEKLFKWQEAETIYGILLKNHYKEANRMIISSYKGGTFEGDEDVPEKLWSAYHRRAEMLTQMLLDDQVKLSPKVYELYKKTALMYAAILEETDYEDDSYDTIGERIEKHENEIKAKTYRSGWFLQSAYVSWRDEIKLKTSTGQVIGLESTGEGTCLGGGWRYENDYWETSLNGCYALTSQTIGNSDSDASPVYFQKGVSSSAFIAGPSFLWKPGSKQVAFGVQIPFVYRQADYEAPVNTELEDTTVFTYGYLLQLDWRLTKWGVTTKFGKIQRFSSSFWSLGALYSF